MMCLILVDYNPYNILESTGSFNFVISLMKYDNPSLKHAITSLISVISSTLRGVEYLITGNNMVS
jgi:hypothetical protein